MSGIFEEPAVALGFQDWADLAALDDASFDVVTAVETGRRLIDQAEDDCLADDYTAGHPWESCRFCLALGTVIVVVSASLAALLILATGWTL